MCGGATCILEVMLITSCNLNKVELREMCIRVKGNKYNVSLTMSQRLLITASVVGMWVGISAFGISRMFNYTRVVRKKV